MGGVRVGIAPVADLGFGAWEGVGGAKFQGGAKFSNLIQ